MHLLCKSQVGLEEGLDGSNVLPVVVEEVCHDLVVLSRSRNDFPAEIIGLGVGVLQQLDHELLAEDIDAHGRNVGLLFGLRRVQACVQYKILSVPTMCLLVAGKAPGTSAPFKLAVHISRPACSCAISRSLGASCCVSVLQATATVR